MSEFRFSLTVRQPPEVAEYSPPHAIAFRQALHVAPLPGRFTIQMTYDVRELGDETRVDRTVSIRAAGAHKLVQPILVVTSRRESGRVMRSLERYLSGL